VYLIHSRWEVVVLELAVLARDLSSVIPSAATQRAAQRFLEMPDPSAVLGRVYGFLVWQRTLRTALAHLEAAGADLKALEVPVQAFRKTFPSNYPTVWKVDREPPVTASDLVDIYTVHRRLLAAPVDALVDAGLDRFGLVSGRAYESRYPLYVHRVEFDTDIVAADMAAGLDVMEALAGAGYPLDSIHIRRLGARPDATFEIGRWQGDHLVSIGVLVGGYHAHRGPICDRTEPIVFRDRPVPTARPEDLLVMLAARAERKARFALVNFNDAAVILDTDGARLDWDMVAVTAEASRLKATLAVVLGRAQRVLGRSVVPAEVWSWLTRGTGLPRAVTERVASTGVAPGVLRTWSVDNFTVRAWRAMVLFRQRGRPEGQSLSSNALIRAQRRILDRQVKAIRSGRPPSWRDRPLTTLRTRSGAMCEVAPHLASTERCISIHGGWHGSQRASTRLREVADGLARVSEDHRCGRLRFDLWSRDGS